MDPTATQRTPRVAVILAAVGLLLAAASTIILVSLPEESVGSVAAVEDALVTGEPPSPASPVDERIASSTADETASGTGEEEAPPAETSNVVPPNAVGRLDEIRGSSALRPVRLLIEGISVDAPVEPYGIDTRTGQMDVPRNVSDVAWYEHGPSPGQPGSAVLAAHVDLAGQGPGVFYRLRDVEPGQRVTVEYEDGSSETFVIQARVTYDKDELPLATVFSREGRPVLTLITCGGGFSESAQSYDSNVVAYAVPIADVDEYPTVEAA